MRNAASSKATGAFEASTVDVRSMQWNTSNHTGSPSLEDVFARATEQEDYTIVARDILSVMQDV